MSSSKIGNGLSNEEKGEKGEQAFQAWLEANAFSYLYVKQTKDVFASVFTGAVKRPDFLVLLESIGLLAVDVKNHTATRGEYTLGYEDEVRRVLAFERLFRIPVWYAYCQQTEAGECWYWISALRALEVGEMRERKDDQKKFLAIKLDEFCVVKTNDDLGQLYTKRLPKAGVSAIETTWPADIRRSVDVHLPPPNAASVPAIGQSPKRSWWRRIAS